jgi:hypothetical protein
MAQEFDAYGGIATAAVPAGTAADTVISPAPGRLCKVLVTTLGTNAMQIFDNASAGSGKIIGQLASECSCRNTARTEYPCRAWYYC